MADIITDISGLMNNEWTILPPRNNVSALYFLTALYKAQDYSSGDTCPCSVVPLVEPDDVTWRSFPVLMMSSGGVVGIIRTGKLLQMTSDVIGSLILQDVS